MNILIIFFQWNQKIFIFKYLEEDPLNIVLWLRFMINIKILEGKSLNLNCNTKDKITDIKNKIYNLENISTG